MIKNPEISLVSQALSGLMESMHVDIYFLPLSKRMHNFGKKAPDGMGSNWRCLGKNKDAIEILYTNLMNRNLACLRFSFGEFWLDITNAESGETELYMFCSSENQSLALTKLLLSESRDGRIFPDSSWGDYRLVHSEFVAGLSPAELILLEPVGWLQQRFPVRSEIYGYVFDLLMHEFPKNNDIVEAFSICVAGDTAIASINSLTHYGGRNHQHDSYEIISRKTLALTDIPGYISELENFNYLRFYYESKLYGIDTEGIWIFSSEEKSDEIPFTILGQGLIGAVASRFVELLILTNEIDDDHYCDECEPDFDELESLMTTIYEYQNLLPPEDGARIMQNLPKNEDHLRYILSALGGTPGFPYREVWGMGSDEYAIEVKMSALSSAELNASNCLYFSFAPDNPVVNFDDFVYSMEKMSSPDKNDIDNILLFLFYGSMAGKKFNFSWTDGILSRVVKNLDYEFDGSWSYGETDFVSILESFRLPEFASALKVLADGRNK